MTNKKIHMLALCTAALFIAGYYPVFQILAEKWANSEEYTHAFLALPIVGYMVWVRRAALLECRPRFWQIGLLLILVSTPLYLFALLTQVHTIITLAMFLTVVGVVLYLGGARAAKEIATPLILFAMLIPIPEQLYIQLTFPLQIKVSQASEIIIRLFGVPLFREGNVMNLPGKSFQVVEACSGLRSVITLMTLSVIMGYFMLRKISSKLVLLAGSIPAAILVNLLRVVAMVLLFHFFELNLTEGTLHTITGVAVFAVALLILLILQRVLELWEIEKK